MNWQQEIDVLKYDSISWKFLSDSMLEVVHANADKRVFWYRNDVLMPDTFEKITFTQSLDTQRFRACTGVDGSCKYCTEEWVVVPKINHVSFLRYAHDGIQLYPNPVVDRLYVQQTDVLNIEKYYISDLCGRILSPVKLIEKSGNDEVVELDVSVLQQGIYILVAICQDGKSLPLGRFLK